jgi:glycosyltransferase involved in cell wall biosynthesis
MIDGTVLMVNKFVYHRGGAEDYMLGLADMLEQEGARAVYFGMEFERNLPVSTSEFFPSSVDFDNPSGTRERVRAVGRMIHSSEARRGIAGLLASTRVDIAHLHNVYHQLSPSIMRPLREAGVPIVMTAHDYKLVCPVYTLTTGGYECTRCVGGSPWNALKLRCNRGSTTGSAAVAFESWLHRRTGAYDPIDVVISPSRYLRDRLVDGGIAPGRVEVIPNFVHAGPPPSEPGDGVLYAGRLSREKGVDVLIRAVTGTPLELRIAGDGPERARLEQLAANLGAPVTFLGHLSRAELQRELESTLTVAVPSTWPENCPLIVLEAMAAGRPLVASRVGGLPELARHDREGLLVGDADVEELRGALLALDSDRPHARALGEAAYERAIAEFSPETHLARILDVYRRLGVTVREGAAA